MSINQWLQKINNPEILLVFFAGLPLLALLTGFFHQRRRGEKTSLRYLYSTLTYASTIPGSFSITLIAYALFFTRTNLLDVNFLVYFLPLISMIVTLMIIGKHAEFSKLPGIDRLSGLITLLAITFSIVLFIFKSRIFIGFFSSIEYLFVLGVLIYLLLKWSLKKISG